MAFMHVGQDNILRMAYPELIMATDFGQMCDHAHLRAAGIARRFKADSRYSVIIVAMRAGIDIHPGFEIGISCIIFVKYGGWGIDPSGGCERIFHSVQKCLILPFKLWTKFRKPLCDKALNFLQSVFMNRDFYARFILVVAASQKVPNADDGLNIG